MSIPRSRHPCATPTTVVAYAVPFFLIDGSPIAGRETGGWCLLPFHESAEGRGVGSTKGRLRPVAPPPRTPGLRTHRSFVPLCEASEKGHAYTTTLPNTPPRPISHAPPTRPFDPRLDLTVNPTRPGAFGGGYPNHSQNQPAGPGVEGLRVGVSIG